MSPSSFAYAGAVEGVEELKAALAAMTEELRRRILADAVEHGADIVRDEVLRRAPEFKGPGQPSPGHRQYGSLKDNLETRLSRPQPGVQQATVGTGDAFWGSFYELGTRHQQPRPFLRPAFDAVAQKAADVIMDDVTTFVEGYGRAD